MSLSINQFPEIQHIDSLSAGDSDSVSNLPELEQDLSFSAEIDFFEVNPKYQEILELDRWLTIAGIPHKTSRLLDGWKVAYTPDGKEISDAVEHFGSYGMEKDLLEVQSLRCLVINATEEETDDDDIYGGMTAFEVFIHWTEHYRGSNSNHYGKGSYIRAWKEIFAQADNVVSKDSYEGLKSSYYFAKKRAEAAEAVDVEFFEHLNALNLIQDAFMAVLFGDSDFVIALASYQTRKHLISYILEELILTAIRQKNYEIQLMLTNYKYRHNLFREKKFEL